VGKGPLKSLSVACWTFWTMLFGCFLSQVRTVTAKKQANLIWQENNILDEDWQRRRDLTSAEHKHADARKQLADGWKMWIGKHSLRARR
jgi:hypothetical protein